MQKIREFLPRARKRLRQIIDNLNEQPTVVLMPYILWHWDDWGAENAAAWVLVFIMLLLGRISEDLRIFIRLARAWFIVESRRYAERKRADKAQ